MEADRLTFTEQLRSAILRFPLSAGLQIDIGMSPSGASVGRLPVSTNGAAIIQFPLSQLNYIEELSEATIKSVAVTAAFNTKGFCF